MEITYKPVGVNETADWGGLRPPHAAVGRPREVDGKKPHSRNEGQQRLSRLCAQPNTQTGFHQL